jgi:hypothetical protein
MSGSKARYMEELNAHAKALEARAEAYEYVGKSEPLRTSVSDTDAKRLVREHGLKGPLPKSLNRNQRISAYEARYVTAGGHKAQKWQHRAENADRVKTAGLVGVTAATGAALTARTHLGRGLKASKVGAKFPHFGHHIETAALASGAAGGAGELYAARARRKRSGYASAPAGVASSALRRLHAYTPEQST